MGSQQSKPALEVAAHEKAVLERLRSMQLESKTGADEGYVYVDNGAEALNEKASSRATPLMREAEDLSVEQLQEWQKQLLEDPKNRFDSRCSHHHPRPPVS